MRKEVNAPREHPWAQQVHGSDESQLAHTVDGPLPLSFNFAPFSPRQTPSSLPSFEVTTSATSSSSIVSSRREAQALDGTSRLSPPIFDSRPSLSSIASRTNDTESPFPSGSLRDNAWSPSPTAPIFSPASRPSTTSFSRSRVQFAETASTSPTAPLHGVSPWSTSREESFSPPASRSWMGSSSRNPLPEIIRTPPSCPVQMIHRRVDCGSSFSSSQRVQPSLSEVEAAWSAKPNAVLSAPTRSRYVAGPTAPRSASYPQSGSVDQAVGAGMAIGGSDSQHGSGAGFGHRPSSSRTGRGGGGQRGWGKGKGRAPSQTEQPSVNPERKPYHPKAPTGGSNWVMWVGNVPHDATLEEATSFFNDMSSAKSSRPSSFAVKYPRSIVSPPTPLPPTPAVETGIVSIFLILQSHCAFVNYSSDAYLQRALSYFNGRPLRPAGVKLVCRVRRKAEEIKSGVGGQRGLGLHRKWVEQNVTNPSLLDRNAGRTSSSSASQSAHYNDALERYAEHLSRPPSGKSLTIADSPSTSTTSTLLATYFPVRYFVLKAMTKSDLQLSVEVGLWATQPHNDFVLEQAFRTSQHVFLIFGANKAGEFHGFARMESSILKQSPETTILIPPSSGSPNQSPMSPFEKHLRQWGTAVSPESSYEPSSTETDATSSDINVDSTSPTETPVPSTLIANQEIEPDGSFDHDRSASSSTSPVDPSIEAQSADRSPGDNDDIGRQWGSPFRVKWICVRGLPFHSTRMLRNPWNKDREVKVSRDGTELESTVGRALLAFWDFPSPTIEIPGYTPPPPPLPHGASEGTGLGLLDVPGFPFPPPGPSMHTDHSSY